MSKLRSEVASAITFQKDKQNSSWVVINKVTTELKKLDASGKQNPTP